MCFAQGHITVPPVGSNQEPIDSEFDTLPLRHRALLYQTVKTYKTRVSRGFPSVHLKSLLSFLGLLLSPTHHIPTWGCFLISWRIKSWNERFVITYIYIFISIALDENIFLDVLYFPMKNIKSCDLEVTPMGRATLKPASAVVCLHLLA